jgi:hypothetical protein
MLAIDNKLGLVLGVAGALTAYFNSFEIADSITRLIVAGGVGALTAGVADLSYGITDEIAAGYEFLWNERTSARVAQAVGVLALSAAATFGGYKLARYELAGLAAAQEQRQQHTAPAPVQAAPKVSLRELENNGFRLTV